MLDVLYFFYDITCNDGITLCTDAFADLPMTSFTRACVCCGVVR